MKLNVQVLLRENTPTRKAYEAFDARFRNNTVPKGQVGLNIEQAAFEYGAHEDPLTYCIAAKYSELYSDELKARGKTVEWCIENAMHPVHAIAQFPVIEQAVTTGRLNMALTAIETVYREGEKSLPNLAAQISRTHGISIKTLAEELSKKYSQDYQTGVSWIHSKYLQNLTSVCFGIEKIYREGAKNLTNVINYSSNGYGIPKHEVKQGMKLWFKNAFSYAMTTSFDQLPYVYPSWTEVSTYMFSPVQASKWGEDAEDTGNELEYQATKAEIGNYQTPSTPKQSKPSSTPATQSSDAIATEVVGANGKPIKKVNQPSWLDRALGIASKVKSAPKTPGGVAVAVAEVGAKAAGKAVGAGAIAAGRASAKAGTALAEQAIRRATGRNGFSFANTGKSQITTRCPYTSVWQQGGRYYGFDGLDNREISKESFDSAIADGATKRQPPLTR